MNEVNDATLIERCLNGNTEAFGGLVKRYQTAIYNLAFRMCKNSDDACEITQVAFVKAFEKLSAFNAHYKFFNWLYRIAINESLNFLKRKKNQTELKEEIKLTTDAPDKMVIDHELKTQVEEALLSLNADYRMLIILKHFRQLSYREIADILNIPEKRVKSRLYSARQQLAGILIKKGVTGNA